MDVVAEVSVFICIAYAAIIEAGLPDFPDESQFFLGPVGESSRDELDGLLNGHRKKWSDQQMKMVGHDHKFMQEILSLLLVVKEDIDEKSGHSFGLQNALFFEA